MKNRYPALFKVVYFTLPIALVAVFVTACGYKPASYYSRVFLKNRIYTKVYVDRTEPENAPYLKDALNDIVINRFGAASVSKKEADTKIYVHYEGSDFRPLSYKDGYVTRYRVYVHMRFKIETKGRAPFYKTVNSMYDTDIDENALNSSVLRIAAIRKGMQKALDEFVAFASAKGILESEKSIENLNKGHLVNE